ncbi:50S ribosomal protein L30e-like protein [Melampsora americana]|nr:50S ribosomal protein L30e-like protein [Melampsora americana]
MGKSDKKRKAIEGTVEETNQSNEITGSVKKKSKSKETSKNEMIMKDGELVETTNLDASLLDALSPIAHPLADKKLGKRVLRTVKKGSKHRFIRRGVKEVVKALRKGDKGLVVMAGDISPMDVLTHIPLLAEENGSGYIFVTSKESLGLASSTKRPTSCVMISNSSGGSAAAKKKQAAKTEALVASDPTKAAKIQEEVEEYTTSYQEVLQEVLQLNEKISY